MPVYVEEILALLVPALVKEAETLFKSPGSGSDKHAWVHGMVQNVFTAFDHFLPAAFKPVEGGLEDLVDEAIETGLEKLGL